MNIKYLIFYIIIILYKPLLADTTVKDELFPVIVNGTQLQSLLAKPIAHIRAYAIHNNKPRAIPFQIDQRDADNNWVWDTASNNKHPVNQADNEDPPGQNIFDQNDQLLFMAFDLGEKADQSMAGINAVHVLELSVSYGDSPVRTGWVYLTYEASPTPRSDIRYMSYQDDTQQITSPVYQLSYAEKSLAIINRMTIDGDEVINQTRLRGTADVNLLLFSKKIQFDASKINGDSVGYINGPIRTIKGFVTSIDIAAGIKSRPLPVTHIFYPHHTEVPLPITRDFLVKNMVLEIDARYPDTDTCHKSKPALHASNAAKQNATDSQGKQVPVLLSLNCPSYSMFTLIKVPPELSDKVNLSAYIIDQTESISEASPSQTDKIAGFHLATGNQFPSGQFYLSVISVFSNQPEPSWQTDNIARIVNRNLSITTQDQVIAGNDERQTSGFSNLSFLSEPLLSEP